MNNKVSPAVSSKQLETNVVRVTRWDFAPYSETGWHITGGQVSSTMFKISPIVRPLF